MDFTYGFQVTKQILQKLKKRKCLKPLYSNDESIKLKYIYINIYTFLKVVSFATNLGITGVRSEYNLLIAQSMYISFHITIFFK